MERYGEQVAVMMPCATFGCSFSPTRYRAFEAKYGCAIVLDAAPALGTRRGGRQFAMGGDAVSVFSLHATKAFATFEGGVIHATDPELIAELRAMGNFGFAAGSRSAAMPGFNTKLSEIIAWVGMAQVPKLDSIIAHRSRLAAGYRALLDGFTLQPEATEAQAYMFLSILLPRHLAPERTRIQARLLASGVVTGTYYSPHLAEQPYFRAECEFGALPVSQDVADRILALPMHNRMDVDDVHRVVTALVRACANL
jgi:dTDP-4-amino-4,6-dideoxygalactose transaminase